MKLKTRYLDFIRRKGGHSHTVNTESVAKHTDLLPERNFVVIKDSVYNMCIEYKFHPDHTDKLENTYSIMVSFRRSYFIWYKAQTAATCCFRIPVTFYMVRDKKNECALQTCALCNGID